MSESYSRKVSKVANPATAHREVIVVVVNWFMTVVVCKLSKQFACHAPQRVCVNSTQVYGYFFYKRVWCFALHIGDREQNVWVDWGKSYGIKIIFLFVLSFVRLLFLKLDISCTSRLFVKRFLICLLMLDLSSLILVRWSLALKFLVEIEA